MILNIEVFLTAIVALVLWWIYNKNKKSEEYKTFPRPPTLPILGNTLDFLSGKEPLDVFFNYIQKYNDLVEVKFGPFNSLVLVADYKMIEFLLSSSEQLDKTRAYHFASAWLGDGLLTTDSEKWRKLRRILNPAFNVKLLEKFVDIFEFNGAILLEKLENESQEHNVDIGPLIALCSLDIICESVMGTNINSQNDGNLSYVHSVKEMCRIIVDRTFSLMEMSDTLYPLSRNYYIQKKVLPILHEKSNCVIKQRRAELKVISEPFEEEKSRKPFLDLLLKATMDGRRLTQEEIREEVDTFLFAGHDTTASALNFILFCLANHPDVQERAFQEQITLFGENRSPTITYADLQNMKYLEQVIKESLRLYPPVPLYGRRILKDIKYDGVMLPKTDFYIFPYALHRNPKYFIDPEDFNPTRWENNDGKLPHFLLTFSLGPRNCIGQKFAMLEIKSIAAKILRTFELLPAVPQHVLKLAAETILISKNGVKIRIRRRL